MKLNDGPNEQYDKGPVPNAIIIEIFDFSTS